jgi:hypothetical protein
MPPNRDNSRQGGDQGRLNMRNLNNLKTQAGKVGYILLWLLGVPIPILFGIYLLRGCT